MKAIKNILRVSFSNILSFGTGFLMNFILPIVLSVVDYGNYRLYAYYVTFSYLLSLGFHDGIYIKYGGKTKEDLDMHAVQQEHQFILVFQTLVALFLFAIGMMQKNKILVYFALASAVKNVMTYHENFIQAIGQFKLFSRVNSFKAVFNIILLLFAFFIFKWDHYEAYIIIHFLTLMVALFIYECVFLSRFGFSKKIDIYSQLTILQTGFFILIANMAMTFVGNVGGWVINLNHNVVDFAYYSFQNSVLNVVLLIVNAVSLVFYNLIAKDMKMHTLKKLKETIVYLGIFSGLAFFIMKWLIASFISKYIPAIELLAMTFIAIPYIMLSKILIMNLYKTKRSDKKYFKDSIICAALSFAFVYVISLLSNELIFIAFGTTICYIVWTLYTCYVEFEYLRFSLAEIILLVTHFLIFYLSTLLPGFHLGMIVYVIYLLTIVWLKKDQLMNLYADFFRNYD